MRKTIMLVGGAVWSNGGVEKYCQRFQKSFERHSEWDVVPYFANTAVFSATNPIIGLWKSLKACQIIGSAIRSARSNADVVWIQYGNGLDLLLLLWIRRTFHGKLLCTLHASERWAHLRWHWIRRLAYQALNGADCLCVLTKHQKQEFTNLTLTKVRKIRTLLPDWINEAYAPEGRNEKSVLFVGRVVLEKGIIDAIDVLERVKQLEEKVVLKVVGSATDAMHERLVREVKSRGMEDSVHFLGHLNEQEIRVLMLNTKVLLHPSYVDTFPLTVLEALACGMHVVTYSITGTEEILSQYAGMAVPIGDKDTLATRVIDVLKGEAAQDDVSRRIAADYEWRIVVEEYERLVRTVI